MKGEKKSKGPTADSPLKDCEFSFIPLILLSGTLFSTRQKERKEKEGWKIVVPRVEVRGEREDEEEESRRCWIKKSKESGFGPTSSGFPIFH